MAPSANTPKPLALDTRVRDGRLEVCVEGELDLASAEGFAAALDAAARQGPDMIVDLTGCDFIDSTGLALILRARRRLEGEKRSLHVKLAGCQVQVRRVFEVGGLMGSPLVAAE